MGGGGVGGLDIYGFDYNYSTNDHILDPLLDRFQWWRKHRGGHWELWYIDVVNGRFWMQFAECSHKRAERLPVWESRPPLGRGEPVCEDW